MTMHVHMYCFELTSSSLKQQAMDALTTQALRLLKLLYLAIHVDVLQHAAPHLKKQVEHMMVHVAEVPT